MKKCITHAAVYTILLAFDMAIPFPKAFPPIVSEAVRPVSSSEIIASSRLYELTILEMITAVAAPLTIPTVSPITSLHIFETLSAFRISHIAWGAAFTRPDAMEWKGVSLAVVVATPTISNTTPINIRMRSIIRAVMISALGISAFERLFIETLIRKDSTTIITTHLPPLPFGILLFFTDIFRFFRVFKIILLN